MQKYFNLQFFGGGGSSSERRSLMMTLNSQITGAFRIAENIRKRDSDVTQRLRGGKK